MAFQLISVSSFSRSIRAGDSKRFSVNLKKHRKEILEDVTREALTAPPILAPYAKTKIRGKACVSYQRYNDNLVIRAISDHLRRRLRVSTIDRNASIEGIVQGLSDGTPMHVLRRDIKDFYETIDVAAFRDRLLFDPLVTPRVRAYLKHFFDQHCPPGTIGLPRGIGLSALLAELHMQEFDRKVRNIEGVYRYYRFADDIFIFSDLPPADIAPLLAASLPTGMAFNAEKSVDRSLTSAETKTVEFLGYQFRIIPPRKEGAGRTICVTMSPRKIARLKSRVIVSVKAFSRTGEFSLLYDRLKYLTSNYEVRRNGQRTIASSTHVRSGIYYNYRYCGTYSVNKAGMIEHTEWDGRDLRALDGFMNSLIYGDGSALRTKVAPKLIPDHRAALRKLSFYHGYHSRILARIQPHRIGEIKSVWRNV